MKKIAILASGNGSNFEALVEASRRGELKAEVAICVCDKPGAYVIERARRLGVPCLVIEPKNYATKYSYESFLALRLRKEGVGLICLAGYMRLIGYGLLEEYGDRILNIHPSLLPAFKGAHAIRDAFEYGVKVYGVTVHMVDETLDGGKIIDQEAFHYDGRDIEELEQRIHAVEHRLYTSAVNQVISNLS